MRTDRRHRVADARTNIGRWIHWRDDHDYVGLITDVRIDHGWPVYVVEWPNDVPSWWADTVATEHPRTVITKE